MQRKLRANFCARRERRSYLRTLERIRFVQQRYRAKLMGRETRAWYIHTKTVIVRLQDRVRATLEMRRCRSTYLAQVACIVSIQRRVRGFLAMKHARREYLAMQQATLRIQCWFRGVLAMREECADYHRQRDLIVWVQQKWRATLCARRERSSYLCTLEKIRFVQQRYRATRLMREVRAAYQHRRAAIIVLQRRYRAHRLMLQIRAEYERQRSFTILVQRRFRARLESLSVHRQFLALKQAAVTVQRRRRSITAMRCQRAQYQQMRAVTIRLQACVRGFLARQRFRALLTPEMIELMRRKKAAKIIQRYWRGYRIRKRTQHGAISTLRKRVQKLKAQSKPVDSVRFKLTEAERLLRGRFIASEALSVLHRLDRLTRTVPHLVSASSQFISTFCYGMMAQAIRSEIDKQLIECCSRIILNLARYDCESTFQEGGLVTIAQMLLRWCDKDCDIFNTLCTLVWIFAHCNKKRRIIRDFMTTAEAIYMIRETKRNTARKEKMKLNARRPPVDCMRGKVLNFALNTLPSRDPDFGIIRLRPYIFISSVFALDTMLRKLEIHII